MVFYARNEYYGWDTIIHCVLSCFRNIGVVLSVKSVRLSW